MTQLGCSVSISFLNNVQYLTVSFRPNSLHGNFLAAARKSLNFNINIPYKEYQASKLFIFNSGV